MIRSFLTLKRLRIGLLLLLVTAVFTAPFFLRPGNWGAEDWDFNYVLAGTPAKIMLEYHQFPLWNPFQCGGMSEVGNPQSILLSPFFLLMLFTGPVIAFKLMLPLFMFTGLAGGYALARYFKISPNGSLLTTIVFNCSGLTILPFVLGMPNFLNFFFVPLLTLLYIQAVRNPGTRVTKCVIMACVITLMFFTSFHYFPLVFVYFGLLSAIETVRSRSINPFVTLGMTVGIFVGIAAVKLLPALFTNLNYPRTIPLGSPDGYSLQTILYSLFSRQQTLTYFQQIHPYYYQSFIDGSSYGIDENGMYVGLAAAVLTIIGIANYKKERLLFLPAMGILLWIMFGNMIPPSLYGFLRTLPLIGYMRVAQRYRYFFMVFFALYAGIGYDKLVFWLSRLMHHTAYILIRMCLIVLIAADIWFVNAKMTLDSFSGVPIVLPKQSTFSHVDVRGQLAYPLILANYGVDNGCDEQLSVPRGFTKKPGQPDYRGEIYLADGLPFVSTWTPNVIRIALPQHISTATRIVVNQNYDVNWHSLVDGSFRSVLAVDQLIAVPVHPGDRYMVLFYLPDSFVVGLAISAGTAGFLGIYFLKRKRKF